MWARGTRLAGLLVAVSASCCHGYRFGDDDIFGPMTAEANAPLLSLRRGARVPSIVAENAEVTAEAEMEDIFGVAEPHDLGNGTNNATTTIAVTTTPLHLGTFVHFAYFSNYAGFYDRTNISAQVDNDKCQLAHEDDTAYFSILRETECECKEMPGNLVTEYRYYQLVLDHQTNQKNEIWTIRAFCKEGCEADECRVDRGPKWPTDSPNNGTLCITEPTADSTLPGVEYDSCTPSWDHMAVDANYLSSDSWFVRQPAVSGETDFDACVLRNGSDYDADDLVFGRPSPPTEVDSGPTLDVLVTTLYMPAGNCNATAVQWDKENDAVIAYTKSTAGGTCTANTPGSSQRLSVNGSTLSGVIACECGLRAAGACSNSCSENLNEDCMQAPSSFDECITDTSDKAKKGSHLAVVRTSSIGASGARFLGECKKMPPHTPGGATTSPQSHTTSAAPKKPITPAQCHVDVFKSNKCSGKDIDTATFLNSNKCAETVVGDDEDSHLPAYAYGMCGTTWDAQKDGEAVHSVELCMFENLAECEAAALSHPISLGDVGWKALEDQLKPAYKSLVSCGAAKSSVDECGSIQSRNATESRWGLKYSTKGDETPKDSPTDHTTVIAIAAACGGVVFLGAILGIKVAKSRKARRMAAYSALQDDPTF